MENSLKHEHRVEIKITCGERDNNKVSITRVFYLPRNFVNRPDLNENKREEIERVVISNIYYTIEHHEDKENE